MQIEECNQSILIKGNSENLRLTDSLFNFKFIIDQLNTHK